MSEKRCCDCTGAERGAECLVASCCAQSKEAPFRYFRPTVDPKDAEIAPKPFSETRSGTGAESPAIA